MEEGFFQQVYDVIAKVPSGRVVTYGQIARHLGRPQGARAVGWAMQQCPEGLPWHRVVNAAGRTSLRGRGEAMQRQRLEEEGVAFGPAGTIDLSIYGWDGI